MISLWCALIFAAGPQASAPSSGTVTLPLSEVLPLMGETGPLEPAPVAAVVVSQQLQGHVTHDTLEVHATWVVTVLDDSRWARLGLLKMAPGVVLDEVSMVDHVTEAVQGGELVMLSRSPGTYTIEAKLSARATGAGPNRSVKLERGRDGLESLLRLEGSDTLSLLTDRELLPEHGSWLVKWRTEVTKREAVQVARPPLEPTVTAARAQVVSTVEGRARLTMRYALQLDRPQTFSIALPEGWAATRLSMNGEARPVVAGPTISLSAEPERSGGKEAVVEVTLEREFGVFHLSGRLALTFPAVSWPTSLLDVSVHLPTVFEYQRLGGSLEPTATLGWSPAAMPGKQLTYQQHLIAAAGPTLELAYSVDLKDRYFKVR